MAAILFTFAADSLPVSLSWVIGVAAGFILITALAVFVNIMFTVLRRRDSGGSRHVLDGRRSRDSIDKGVAPE